MESKHEQYCAKMSKEERMLIALRDELYDGSWDNMLQDLSDRLKGKPYIFKLVNRIEEDIQRIERLKEYEEENKIDLAEFVEA